jgi:NTE family protein
MARLPETYMKLTIVHRRESDMSKRSKVSGPGKDGYVPKVAVGCQGGGMHAAFEVGVLTEILKDVEHKRFELVGLSGTSAGALCALMVWLGLVPKTDRPGSVRAARDKLNRFWDGFVANTPAEKLLNFFSFRAFRAQEAEIPWFGVNVPLLTVNPCGGLIKAVTSGLPFLGIRKQYYEFEDMLAEACPEFNSVNWPEVKTRLLLGASEVVHGFETVFDSDINKGARDEGVNRWRKRMPLTLRSVAASGTLPTVREAEPIDGGYYWDGLYSQNPPVREFLAKCSKEETPDELWIVRINPQQWPKRPITNSEIMDRQNELMGNLSLNKELDFILMVNDWIEKHGDVFAEDSYKHVTVRTIKMREETADELRYSSKFDRSLDFVSRLRDEGHAVARDWLDRWPGDVGTYPDDAAYRARR